MKQLKVAVGGLAAAKTSKTEIAIVVSSTHPRLSVTVNVIDWFPCCVNVNVPKLDPEAVAGEAFVADQLYV